VILMLSGAAGLFALRKKNLLKGAGLTGRGRFIPAAIPRLGPLTLHCWWQSQAGDFLRISLARGLVDVEFPPAIFFTLPSSFRHRISRCACCFAVATPGC